MKKLTLCILCFIISSGVLFATEVRTPEIPEMANSTRDTSIKVSPQTFMELGFIVPPEPIPAIDFTVVTLDGSQVRLSDFVGSLVALNLWATWCPPCKEEMPSMNRIYNEIGGEDFSLLAVATPYPPQETEASIREFADTYNYGFPILLDLTMEVATVYGTGSVPTTWIIDNSGYIRAVKMGYFQWDTPEIKELFQALMKE